MRSAEHAPIYALGEQWAAAERAGDADALDGLLSMDFEAVGPSGYVLDRAGWLARHRDGTLSYSSFDWAHAEPRVHGRTAIVIGLQAASADVGGETVAGRYRATLIAVEQDGRWRIAGLQLSELPDGI